MVLIFSISQAFPHNIVTWIHFLGFSNAMHKKSLLRAVGSIIGNVIKVDHNTEATTRRHFSRCGRYEHVKDVCPSTHIGLQHTDPIIELKLLVEFMELRMFKRRVMGLGSRSQWCNSGHRESKNSSPLMGRGKCKGPMGENISRLLDLKLRVKVRQVPSTLNQASIVVIDENEDPNVIKDGKGEEGDDAQDDQGATVGNYTEAIMRSLAIGSHVESDDMEGIDAHNIGVEEVILSVSYKSIYMSMYKNSCPVRSPDPNKMMLLLNT
ncbi:hypothetical protein GOBAR_DD18814 [Gossypium barbadense]|nr:hypothetical protein GOBAR_DD18814 [Gossypium barbadense]